MSDDMIDNRRPSNGDLSARLERIEDKLDRRLNILDDKVDHVSSRLDRMEGALGMLKWLGPTGVVAIMAALFRAFS